MTFETGVETLVEILRAAPRITVMTGAGVSVASGIPTFRGPEGIWKDFKPEEVATPGAFERDPKFVWEWYEHRRGKLRDCKPNRGHNVLADWSRRFPVFKLFTQNVDGLHELAGTENVTRYHGSLWDVGCWEDCPESPYRWFDDTHPFPQLPPPCPHCGGLLRPGVVWFGEAIDPNVLREASLAVRCDLFLTIGTSALVYPAAAMVQQAKAQGSVTVEINPEPTTSGGFLDFCLAGKSEEVLDRVEARLSSSGTPEDG